MELGERGCGEQWETRLARIRSCRSLQTSRRGWASFPQYNGEPLKVEAGGEHDLI